MFSLTLKRLVGGCTPEPLPDAGLPLVGRPRFMASQSALSLGHATANGNNGGTQAPQKPSLHRGSQKPANFFTHPPQPFGLGERKGGRVWRDRKATPPTFGG